MSKSPSASPALSVREFFARFPNEDACLTHIMNVRFGGTTMDCPECGSVGVTFHKLRERRVYACPECRFQIAPTANTILHDTRTPLVSWFYAMYLFCTTRHGVSGKELQRQLGVTYKTAYRMGMQIRTLTAKAGYFEEMLSGHVEADESYIGGRVSGGKRGRGAPGKTIVMGLVERGGNTIATVVPNVKKTTLREVVLDNVQPGSIVSTDELKSYGLLTGDGFKHGTVQHGRKEWSRFDYGTKALSCCRFRGHRDKVFLEPEDGDATTEVQPRVQARGGEAGAGTRGVGIAGGARSGPARERAAQVGARTDG